MRVSTADPRAQLFFDQGLRLLYAVNHAEARRAFQEASRLDPSLAMSHWGEALTLAPNLNAPMTIENARLARAASRRAAARRSSATAREQALIDAITARFAAEPTRPRPPLDRAYADAMTRAATAYPDDADVQTLYADAVMNTMPWDYWLKDGSAKPETARLLVALERTITLHPDHPGAHHYLVHLVEASPTPERAERSADRLGGLMPAAGHMVHMPAHIYLRVGRYADAAEANVRAIAADEDYLAQCQAQGLYPVSYYPHNLHFLWAAATLEGRRTVAVDAARQVAAKVPHHHAGALSWTADFPVTPWLAYVRFGQWREMLTEPSPPPHEPYVTGVWHYARALAFVARGDAARGEAELAALGAVMQHRAFKTTLKDLPLLTNLQIAGKIVRGELGARAGRHDEAVAALREAVESIGSSNGTPFYDGLERVAREVFRESPRDEARSRRALVALTDGVDSTSESEFADAREQLRRAGLVCYFIQVNTEEFVENRLLQDCADNGTLTLSRQQLQRYRRIFASSADAADYSSFCRLGQFERMDISRALYKLARQEMDALALDSGGRTYPVAELREARAAFARIAAEIGTQYSLGYYPTNKARDGRFRSIRVEVRGVKNAQVRAREGYRAPQS
jgi:VWFA-related protein